tara:strand:+ start:370 stop:813 length:444 start_codon:yes stop_codon:yes gene_type:complete
VIFNKIDILIMNNMNMNNMNNDYIETSSDISELYNIVEAHDDNLSFVKEEIALFTNKINSVNSQLILLSNYVNDYNDIYLKFKNIANENINDTEIRLNNKIKELNYITNFMLIINFIIIVIITIYHLLYSENIHTNIDYQNYCNNSI